MRIFQGVTPHSLLQLCERQSTTGWDVLMRLQNGATRQNMFYLMENKALDGKRKREELLGHLPVGWTTGPHLDHADLFIGKKACTTSTGRFFFLFGRYFVYNARCLQHRAQWPHIWFRNIGVKCIIDSREALFSGSIWANFAESESENDLHHSRAPPAMVQCMGQLSPMALNLAADHADRANGTWQGEYLVSLSKTKCWKPGTILKLEPCNAKGGRMHTYQVADSICGSLVGWCWGWGWERKKVCVCLALGLACWLASFATRIPRWPAHSHALPFSVHASLQHSMSQVSVWRTWWAQRHADGL